MNARRRPASFASLSAVVLLAMTLAGCSTKNAVIDPNPNQRPVLELTRAPYNESTRFEYSYRMNWLGYDPDGRIDYFQYAIDPPSPTAFNPRPETTWVNTTRSEQTVNFSATTPDNIRPNENGSSDFHTFVVKAIDNGGNGGPLQSAPLIRSFFTYTIAPTVQIQSPAPSDRGRTYVTPSVRITWTGTDEDGILNNKKPNKYKYILLTQNTGVPFQVALANPDSVRRYYAPRNWAGWDSTSADTTTKQFTNLVPGQDYVFVVIAFDEAGAYSPIFSQNSNMLNMRATFAATGGPLLTMFNEIFFYEYNTAVYSSLPQYQAKIEIPAGEQVSFNWIGVAGPGADTRGYRWTLDIDDLSDNTPRTNERTDIRHWSQQSNTTTATVGPFAGGETHLFYIEAEDNNGLRSLGTIFFTVVQASLDKPLLVVTDTRLTVDQASGIGGLCMNPPTNRWPSSAELDTFLFARGGKPYRCYPTGAVSPVGIFTGYPFDTTGTRTGVNEVRVPLAKIGRYSHVVWITDSKGGTNSGPGTNLATSQSALRYMSDRQRASSLGAYIKQGGEVWMLGGGASFATMIAYDKTGNNTTNPAPGITFSDVLLELVPGRFMYDVVKWQSEIKTSFSPMQITRYRGRYDATGRTVPVEYRNLPTAMRGKTAALGDAFPPGRTVNNGDFYLTNFDCEYLSRPNRVIEDIDPDLLIVNEQSTLDTLYRTVGPSLMPASVNPFNVCMTRYVGPSYTHLIFTGFNIWNFTRGDCKQLVDAVLQDMWHLPYTPPSVPASVSSVRRTEPDPDAVASAGVPPGSGTQTRAR